MKKVISVLLILVLSTTIISASATNADSAIDIQLQVVDGRISNNSGLQQAIDDYFAIRKDALTPTKARTNSDVTITNALNDISTSQEIIETETARLFAIDNLAEYHGVHVISCNNNASITSAIEISPLTSELDVYEWTWIEYNDGKGGPTDSMGYATEHTMTLEAQGAGTFKLVSDIYDESDILGVPEDSLNFDFPITADNNLVRASGTNTNVSLNVNDIIDYADKWVVHEYSSELQQPDTYNKSVYGYYAMDCANFVSQCLKVGGMTNDYGSGKDNGNWDGTQWWFDMFPSPQYENYEVSPPSWRYVPKVIEYWKNKGYSNVSATTSSVYPGNPVLNGTSHVGICVGYNSADSQRLHALAIILDDTQRGLGLV